MKVTNNSNQEGILIVQVHLGAYEMGHLIEKVISRPFGDSTNL